MWWIVVVIVVGVLIYASNRPNQFRIERSLGIHAAPEKVFAYLIDFHQWHAWSPWANLDPNMQATFSGAEQGIGAVHEWKGNNKVGQGRMEIVGAIPPNQLRIKLDFFKPFEAHNTAEFTLQTRDGGTHVTWAMFGPSPFISKLMSLFFNMDKLIGRDFERGLSSLKLLAEK
jgi:uncharacterized protein YndB with AHSA1/START domain